MRARALPVSLATARQLDSLLYRRVFPSRACPPALTSAVGGGGATTSSRHHQSIPIERGPARANAAAGDGARAMASSAQVPLPAPQPTPETDEVKTVVASGVAEVLLDRPKALNALNVPMVLALRRLYAGWDAEAAAPPPSRQQAAAGAAVGAVVLRAAPSVRDRAFCAGGDVKGVVQDAREGRVREALAFFEHEYACDWAIGGPLAAELEKASPRGAALAARPPPPLPPALLPLRVALVDGIVMGGGVGLSLHGHAVVATERTVFSMPEVAIGLHPDVGAMARLVAGAAGGGRGADKAAAQAAQATAPAPAPSPSPLHGGLLTRRVGLWLALSGMRVGGGALKALGLATHCVPSWRLDEAVAALRRRQQSGGGGTAGGSAGGGLAGDPAALSAVLAPFEFASEEEADAAAEEDARMQAEGKARRAGAPSSSAPAAAATAAAAMTARELRARLPLIEAAFGAGDAAQRAGDPGAAVTAIVAALRAAAAATHTDNDGNRRFAAAAADAIEGGSALSAAVTLEYAARAAAGGWGLRECLEADYGLVQRFVAGEQGDFWEGVRAKLVDKGPGAAPARWRFPSAAAVPRSAVEAMLAGPLDPGDAKRALRVAGIWEQQSGGRARL